MSGQKKGLDVVFVYNKTNEFGIQKDAKILELAIRDSSNAKGFKINSVRHSDHREPQVPCDICIHLEVPYASWFPWARFHVAVVNPEWWVSSWNGYKSQIHSWIFKTDGAQTRFIDAGLCTNENSSVIHWRCNGNLTELLKNPMSDSPKDGWVWFLAGSTNKRAAAKAILPLWKPSYPKLTVYSVSPLDLEEGCELSSNVNLVVKDLSPDTQAKLAAFYPGHICFSKSEGFGYTAAESEFVGAFTALNSIEAYKELYTGCDGVVWLETFEVAKDFGLYADFSDSSHIQKQLDTINKTFSEADIGSVRQMRRSSVLQRNINFNKCVLDWFSDVLDKFESIPKLPKHMPPILNGTDCPLISILTLVHGRPQFLDLAFHNLMLTDYPRKNIEWVIVDDSLAMESGSDKIQKFEETFFPGKVTYVPLPKKVSIGKKRNIAVKKASHDILLMMDDDDHYPQTSFRRRVAWLGFNKKASCAVCTTIALYDLQNGVSAVNVPPFDLSLAQRCSEATLTFTRDFWLEKPFPDTHIGEGEGFLEGREDKILEMPPQQIIIAFNHGQNTSTRRIPGVEAGKGCFWQFPRPYLEFIHGLAGVKVEQA
jgi:hypothetical protein